MNWKVWDKVERLLTSMAIRPIVGVVPDNRDPKLNVAAPLGDFWSRVRNWQSQGWTVGWHGFRHVYETTDPGILGLNARSEFAGLAAQVQRQKLQDAHAIFVRNGVQPAIWVAPGHSFDERTVELLQEFGIRAISDGFYFRPVIAFGSLWIPQQLWRFRRMPSGLWTVCYHANNWSEADLRRFASDLRHFSPWITSVADVLGASHPRRSVMDAAFSLAYRRATLLKRSLAI